MNIIDRLRNFSCPLPIDKNKSSVRECVEAGNCGCENIYALDAADEIEQLRADNDLACAINEELAEKYNAAKAEIERLQKRLAANSPHSSGL